MRIVADRPTADCLPTVADNMPTRHAHYYFRYPGRSISNDSDAFQEAEMDPVHEVELRARIEGDGHTIVGWCVFLPFCRPFLFC